MADLFDPCLTFTLTQEGGYVDDPADPGGATNMGITLATLRHWDHEPTLGPADVQDMTRQIAAAIYRTLYWNALRGDSLPAGVDLSTFDFGVNAGTRRSAELLQQVLGLPPGQVDGAVGQAPGHPVGWIRQLRRDLSLDLAPLPEWPGQGLVDRGGGLPRRTLRA